MSNKLDECQQAMYKKFRKDYNSSALSTSEIMTNDFNVILTNIAEKLKRETDRYVQI